jgi:hypothetical protein
MTTRIMRIEETHFGKLLQDPEKRKHHDQIVAQLREEARPEIKALERSERITWEDLHGPTFYCS